MLNAETARFTPERSRDIAAPLFAYNSCPNKFSNTFGANFSNSTSARVHQLDSHDCSWIINLSGSMQSNVPKPFCAGNRSTHLNMPGGEWARDEKYLAGDMKNSHFTTYQMRIGIRRGVFDG